MDILSRYNIKPNSTKEGLIFESIAITQIINLIKRYNKNITYYYIRTSQGDIEYNLVLQTYTDVYFIGFKRSSRKINKYINSDKVIQYFSQNYPELCIHFHTVYLNKSESIEHTSTYHIDDYLYFVKTNLL